MGSFGLVARAVVSPRACVFAVVAAIGSAMWAGCASGVESQGSLGEACYPNGTCDTGLFCNRAAVCDAEAKEQIPASPAVPGAPTALEGCALAGNQRCVEGAPQRCNGAHWVDQPACAGATSCIGGRCVPMATSCPVRASYDGNIEEVGLSAPEPVSGCIAAGSLPLTIRYIEQAADERQRSVAFRLVDGLPADCAQAIAAEPLSSVFGRDVTDTVSSTLILDGSHTFELPPGQSGQLHRQAAQLQSVAILWSTDGAYAGSAILTDWSYIATIKPCSP